MSKTEKHIEYWPNGKKRIEGLVRDGIDVKMTEWHENGQKSGVGTYKDGKPCGIWTKWYENGQKHKEITFKDGKLIDKKEF